MNQGRRRIVVVGASAAGLRCASRLARLQPTWQITVVEQNETFSAANCGLPYVLSGEISEVDALRRTMDGALRDASYFEQVKGIEVLAGCRAIQIDADAQTLRMATSQGSRTLVWDELVLATGGRPRRLPSQPLHPLVHTLHTPAHLLPMLAELRRGGLRRIVVIGAGFLGCEVTEAFRSLWDAEVTLLEAGLWPLPSVVNEEVGLLVAAVLRQQGVQFHTGVRVDSIDSRDTNVTVHAGDQSFTADAAVVALGVEPVVELAAHAGVHLGQSGAILVDEHFATSLLHVWAIGDCIEVRHAITGKSAHLPLGSLANRQGRILANVLAGGHDALNPVAGTLVMRLFDHSVGSVGLTRAQLAEHGMASRSVWLSTQDRAHYMPEAKSLALELTYSPKTLQVLGIQAVGEADVSKPLTSAAACLSKQATLTELAAIEHAYAPPFAGALDPLVVAAHVALNQDQGVVSCSPVSDLGGLRLLDVRHPDESKARPLAGELVTTIPLEQLRAKLPSLPLGDWVVVCERGARSAEATRILQAASHGAHYLGGGLVWRMLALG